MDTFEPDYTNLQKAAWNFEADRLPLYEHIISADVMEEILNNKFASLYDGDDKDLLEFFKNYCNFFKQMGYDTVSFEVCFSEILPGGGALGNSSITPAIQNWDDFNSYPWQEIPVLYHSRAKRYFTALEKSLPSGMQAVGGVGNGVFECVQDLVGFENLCYLGVDEPELYEQIFKKTGEALTAAWQGFLKEFSGSFCVLRFGDDLGYKSDTMLSASDIREHIIPVYRKIIAMVHNENKPFLLHSCGAIFDVMEDLIDAGINAKHSNEDQIAPFPEWVEMYGDRIGNFGGIDTDAVCRLTRTEMREYITDVTAKSRGRCGFAFGSGNSIPNYVPPAQYLMMNEIIREIRNA